MGWLGKFLQIDRRWIFLAIGIVKPHLPWRVPRKYYDMHPLDSIALPPYPATARPAPTGRAPPPPRRHRS